MKFAVFIVFFVYHIPSCSFISFLYHCVYDCMFCILLFNPYPANVQNMVSS